MVNREQHHQDVSDFLNQEIDNATWELTIPYGWGNETYFAKNETHHLFIKLGAQIERYNVLSAINLSPPVLKTGYLHDGTPILVQSYIHGHHPTRHDFQTNLERFARRIKEFQNCASLKKILTQPKNESYRENGLAALFQLKEQWLQVRQLVPPFKNFINQSLLVLEGEINQFAGGGLVVSHQDICNANWLISDDKKIYLIDLESMTIDDPAADLGALLWWYYPPEQREEFLHITGFAYDENLKKRMQVRMAIHCLHIILPRRNSFDRFNPDQFDDALTDFRAVLAGKENPQGYAA